MSGILKVGGSELINDNGGSGSLQWGSSVPKGSVIEQFTSPCDGSSITVQSGTYAVGNVTGEQDFNDNYEDVTGSAITYTPPTGTQTVIYSFNFHVSRNTANNSLIGHFRLYIAGTEVVYARHTIGDQSGYDERPTTMVWAFNIGGSANTNTGRQASWTSGKEIKLQARRYSSGHKLTLHETYHFDGAPSANLHVPIIGITALA